MVSRLIIIIIIYYAKDST